MGLLFVLADSLTPVMAKEIDYRSLSSRKYADCNSLIAPNAEQDDSDKSGEAGSPDPARAETQISESEINEQSETDCVQALDSENTDTEFASRSNELKSDSLQQELTNLLSPVEGSGIVIDSIEHLRDAINVAESGVTLYLASNLTYDESTFQTIVVSKEITIDFGDYKISAVVDPRGGVALFNVSEGGLLTFVNAEIEGGTADAYDDIIGVNDGSVVVESTKGRGFTTSNFVLDNNGSLIIKGGTFNVAYNIVDESYGSIEVDSGTFRSDGYGFDEVYGQLIINNADIITDGPCISVEAYDGSVGKVEINGGTFTSISDSCISNIEGSVVLGATSYFKTMAQSNPCFYARDPSIALFEIADHSFPSVEDWESAPNVTIFPKKILEKISVPVKVEWVGPEKGSVSVALLAGGAEVQRIYLSEAEGWQGSFMDAMKYEGDDAHEIAYSVSGDPVAGYSAEYSGNAADGFKIVYSITGKTSIPVSVSWSGGMEEKAVIHLHADGQEIASYELNAQNNWKFTFADIEEYQSGKERSFTLTEDSLAGYSTEITYNAETGFLVMNTKKPTELLKASSEPQTPKEEVRPTSTRNTSSNESFETPNTKDSFKMWIYLALFITAMLGAGMVLVLLESRKN